jgi:hypothetical protein
VWVSSGVSPTTATYRNRIVAGFKEVFFLNNCTTATADTTSTWVTECASASTTTNYYVFNCSTGDHCKGSVANKGVIPISSGIGNNSTSTLNFNKALVISSKSQRCWQGHY